MRRTRAESREDTRARMVEAASRRFLTDGFKATSLEQVARDAGFSTGAVYSNFSGKTDLGLAVVEALYAREGRRLQEALGASEGDWFGTIAAWAQDALGDPAWARLEVELAASSIDPRMEAAFAERYAKIRHGLAGNVLAYAEAQGVRLAVSPEVAATALLALVLGLGVQRAVDPQIPGTVLADVLRAVAA